MTVRGWLAVVLVGGVSFVLGFYAAGHSNFNGTFAPAPETSTAAQVMGKVNAISDNSLTLETEDGRIETILFSSTTRIEESPQMTSIGALNIGDTLAVFGSRSLQNGVAVTAALMTLLPK